MVPPRIASDRGRGRLPNSSGPRGLNPSPAAPPVARAYRPLASAQSVPRDGAQGPAALGMAGLRHRYAEPADGVVKRRSLAQDKAEEFEAADETTRRERCPPDLQLRSGAAGSGASHALQDREFGCLFRRQDRL